MQECGGATEGGAVQALSTSIVVAKPYQTWEVWFNSVIAPSRALQYLAVCFCTKVIARDMNSEWLLSFAKYAWFYTASGYIRFNNNILQII